VHHAALLIGLCFYTLNYARSPRVPYDGPCTAHQKPSRRGRGRTATGGLMHAEKGPSTGAHRRFVVCCEHQLISLSRSMIPKDLDSMRTI
jgi:hypothetical protein